MNLCRGWGWYHCWLPARFWHQVVKRSVSAIRPPMAVSPIWMAVLRRRMSPSLIRMPSRQLMVPVPTVTARTGAAQATTRALIAALIPIRLFLCAATLPTAPALPASMVSARLRVAPMRTATRDTPVSPECVSSGPVRPAATAATATHAAPTPVRPASASGLRYSTLFQTTPMIVVASSVQLAW